MSNALKEEVASFSPMKFKFVRDFEYRFISPLKDTACSAAFFNLISFFNLLYSRFTCQIRQVTSKRGPTLPARSTILLCISVLVHTSPHDANPHTNATLAQ
eukprot:scaffold4946_cov139-Skeletonema_dohrnii-CCMP3373.AAC.6